MTTTSIASPTSLIRFGFARTEITPPVGIYHRIWGAARHDRAAGVHRPLFGDVMAFGSVDSAAEQAQGLPLLIRVQLDLCGLVQSQYDDVTQALCEAGGVPSSSIVITFSHTHSSGWFASDRLTLPGGDLIPPYLQQLSSKLQEACRQAVADMQEVTLTYAVGQCNLAANRDCRDEVYGGYVCGFNPDSPADDTVVVVRVTDTSNRLQEVSHFAGGISTVNLPLKPKPDRMILQKELEEWEAYHREADARGDVVAARDSRAYAERARRWLARLDDLPEGTTFPLRFSVHRMGDAIWVTSGGEPYNLLQVELRKRFPDRTLLFSPLAGNMQVAYLLSADRYGKGLYQEEPSMLAQGCLEMLIDAIATRIEGGDRGEVSEACR